MKRRWLQFAWPVGAVDQLLRAATLEDRDAARAAWLAWSQANAIEDAPANVARLLAALAGRLPHLAPESPLKPRIVGLERQLWTRSQLVVREVLPGIDALREAGIELLLFKGTALVAGGVTRLRGRVVSDVDVFVRPDDFRAAFDRLADVGWRPAGTGSVPFHRATLFRRPSVNLRLGRMGDLDLHREIFHHSLNAFVEDEKLWRRSIRGDLLGRPVRVPGPADAALIAAAHGADTNHVTSDWLIDIVSLIDSPGFDPDILVEAATARGLALHVAIAFSYVAERLGRASCGSIVDRLLAADRLSVPAAAGALLGARPLNRLNPPLALVLEIRRRALRASLRRAIRRRHPASVPSFLRLPDLASGDSPRQTFHESARLPCTGMPAGGATFDISLAVLAGQAARRIEIELHADGVCVARLRSLKWRSRRPIIRLRYRIALTINRPAGEFTIVAAPGRHVRPDADDAFRARYAAAPLAILKAEIRSAEQPSG